MVTPRKSSPEYSFSAMAAPFYRYFARCSKFLVPNISSSIWKRSDNSNMASLVTNASQYHGPHSCCSIRHCSRASLCYNHCNILYYICTSMVIHSFIHSGHFYSAHSSPLLLRGAPDYSTDTVSEFHAEAHRQLQVKDLPKVPTWRLERESNPRPSG